MSQTASRSPKKAKPGTRSRLGGGHGSKQQLPQGSEKAEPSLEFRTSTDDELIVEDLATVPRSVSGDDNHEESMDFVAEETLSPTSQKPTMIAGAVRPPSGRNLVQESPRGPEDFGGHGPAAAAATSTQVEQGPDLHSSMPITYSPGAAEALAPKPHSSAPVGTASSPNSRRTFLKGKLKVGGMRSASTHHRDHSKHRTGKIPDFRLPFDPMDDDPTNGTSNVATLATEQQSEARNPQEQEPEPAYSFKGGKMKFGKNFSMSFAGLKHLASTGRNFLGHMKHADTLDHDDQNKNAQTLASLEEKKESTRSLTKPGLSRSFTDEIALDVARHLKDSESAMDQKEEAKRRRRKKHQQRKLKQGNSSHSSAHGVDIAGGPGPPLKRGTKQRQNKLDREARERLKKHSAENDLRKRSANRERRKQVLAASRQDLHFDHKEDSKQSTMDDDDKGDEGGLLKPQATVRANSSASAASKGHPKPGGALRSTSAAAGGPPKPDGAVRSASAAARSQGRGHGDLGDGDDGQQIRPTTGTGPRLRKQKKKEDEKARANTGTDMQVRKQKKKEDEKLRERVRRSLHQSFNNDVSFSLRDLLDEEDQGNESDEENATFAEDVSAPEAATVARADSYQDSSYGHASSASLSMESLHRAATRTSSVQGSSNRASSTSLSMDSLHKSSGHHSSFHGSSSLRGFKKASHTSSTSTTTESLQRSSTSTLPSSGHGSSLLQGSSSVSNQLSYQSVSSHQSENYLQLVITDVDPQAQPSLGTPSAKKKTAGKHTSSKERDPAERGKRATKGGPSRSRTDGSKGTERRRRRSLERPAPTSKPQYQRVRAISEPRKPSKRNPREKVEAGDGVFDQSPPILVTTSQMGNESSTKRIDVAEGDAESKSETLEVLESKIEKTAKIKNDSEKAIQHVNEQGSETKKDKMEGLETSADEGAKTNNDTEKTLQGSKEEGAESEIDPERTLNRTSAGTESKKHTVKSLQKSSSEQSNDSKNDTERTGTERTIRHSNAEVAESEYDGEKTLGGSLPGGEIEKSFKRSLSRYKVYEMYMVNDEKPLFKDVPKALHGKSDITNLAKAVSDFKPVPTEVPQKSSERHQETGKSKEAEKSSVLEVGTEESQELRKRYSQEEKRQSRVSRHQRKHGSYRQSTEEGLNDSSSRLGDSSSRLNDSSSRLGDSSSRLGGSSSRLDGSSRRNASSRQSSERGLDNDFSRKSGEKSLDDSSNRLDKALRRSNSSSRRLNISSRLSSGRSLNDSSKVSTSGKRMDDSSRLSAVEKDRHGTSAQSSREHRSMGTLHDQFRHEKHLVKHSGRGREGQRADSNGNRRRHSADSKPRKKPGRDRSKTRHKET